MQTNHLHLNVGPHGLNDIDFWHRVDLPAGGFTHVVRRSIASDAKRIIVMYPLGKDHGVAADAFVPGNVSDETIQEAAQWMIDMLIVLLREDDTPSRRFPADN